MNKSDQIMRYLKQIKEDKQQIKKIETKNHNILKQIWEGFHLIAQEANTEYNTIETDLGEICVHSSGLYIGKEGRGLSINRMTEKNNKYHHGPPLFYVVKGREALLNELKSNLATWLVVYAKAIAEEVETKAIELASESEAEEI